MKNNAGLPIGLGICFFVMFWQAFDSLALGIGLGVAMGAAFATSANRSKENDCGSEDKGSSENSQQ